jgi:hypothetical protein
MPFAGRGQALPHAPQLFASVERAMHTDPQSVLPAGHIEPHTDDTHTALPPVGRGQTLPHAPQLFGSLAVSTQEDPQRVCVATHPFVHIVVPLPEEQTGVVPLHIVPHAPQFDASARLASQPFAAAPSQSANPGSHAIVQAIPLHTPRAFVATGQAVPHAPQLAASLARSTSHPFAALWSQSAKPLSHEDTAHDPAAQLSVACAATHAFAHAPQCIASSASEVSQPSTTLPLQSPYPTTQLFVHVPPEHAVRTQARPHAPQLAGSSARLTHVPSQHVSSDKHAAQPPSETISASADAPSDRFASSERASTIVPSRVAPSVNARYRSRLYAVHAQTHAAAHTSIAARARQRKGACRATRGSYQATVRCTSRRPRRLQTPRSSARTAGL